MLRGVLEEVGLRSDHGVEGGYELLADGVERRIGHLREELREVVEDQAGPAGQHGDGSVGAHRAQRLGPGGRHGREQHPQLLLGVAEGLLPAHHRGRGVADVFTIGQVLEPEEPLVEPLPVGVLGGEAGLDLLVLHDPPGPGVDEEHLPRFQPPLADDGLHGDVEHSRFGGQDHEAVIGDPVPAGAQPVAVEDGADHGPVREADGGRAVPGLHDGGHVLVEGPPRRVHGIVVLPRLRDHHQHRVRQGAAREMQQLHHLVEGRRVGGPRGVHVAQLGEIAQQVRMERPLPRRHPVAVATQRVDLAVVRQQTERLRQRPGRERVGGEPGVHEGDLRGEALVVQVREELAELRGGQHALVDQRAGGEGGEVDAQAVLAPLAHPVGPAVEGDAGQRVGRAQEELAEDGHAVPCHAPDHAVVDRQVAPAENLQALVGDDLLDVLHRRRASCAVGRQEGRPDGVTARFAEREGRHPGEELVRDLREDSGAVARVHLGADSSTVVEVGECCQARLNNVPPGIPPEGGHERHTTGVVLIGRVVQPACGPANRLHVPPILAGNSRSHLVACGTPLARTPYSALRPHPATTGFAACPGP